MRKSLFGAKSWIKVVVYRRCAQVGEEWALSNTSTVWRTAAIELRCAGIKVGLAGLTICIAVGGIGTRITETRRFGRYSKLCVGKMIARRIMTSPSIAKA